MTKLPLFYRSRGNFAVTANYGKRNRKDLDFHRIGGGRTNFSVNALKIDYDQLATFTVELITGIKRLGGSLKIRNLRE